MARPAQRATGSRRPNPALRLAAIRQFHTYLGVFIAPSILFFAFTGALQLFSLHEAHGDYHPPALIEKLATLHKDQKFSVKEKHKGPPKAEPEAKAHGDGDDHDHDHAAPPAKAAFNTTLALKWLFLVVAIGLIASTLLGLWMAVAHGRRKGVIWILLILGVVLPVLLVIA